MRFPSRSSLLLTCLMPGLLLFGMTCAADDEPTPPNFKVALVGDQGQGEDSLAVLKLIHDEKPNLVVLLGDFDYADDPHAWDAQVTKGLQEEIPLLAVVGNHDLEKWEGPKGYAARLLRRQKEIKGASCKGNVGSHMTCAFHGVTLALSGVGTLGSNHEKRLAEALSSSKSIWKICAWHKNQSAMQMGDKLDEVGWTPYEICREHGAIIASGHDHTYARTKTLTSMSTQQVEPTCDSPDRECVGAGKTFAVVAGTGGHSIRKQLRCLPTTYPYGCNHEWAKIYTEDQGATFGALFLTFNVDGDPYKARGYFKTVKNEIADSFEIQRDIPHPPTPKP